MTLKEAYKDYFKVGVAVAKPDITIPENRSAIVKDFNSVTSENHMKPWSFLDQEKTLADSAANDLAPVLNFDRAKPYLDFAKENGLSMRGHTLVWHNQTPKWFFHKNYDETAEFADKETMFARLESYIKGVLTYVQTNYPGLIYAWDVVNEAVDEGEFRKKSFWHQTCGPEFIFKAFEYARKYADPSVLLFYNDYETAEEWKRDYIIEHILKPLQEKGLVDGMGMQSHLLMDHPDLGLYQKALEMYGALGLQIHITELDMHNADPSEESQNALAKRYAEFFKIYLDAKKNQTANVTCVTFWNLKDDESWLTYFRKETSYPLLFDNNCQPKPAYYAVLELPNA